jgi:hypothetical protein
VKAYKPHYHWGPDANPAPLFFALISLAVIDRSVRGLVGGRFGIAQFDSFGFEFGVHDINTLPQSQSSLSLLRTNDKSMANPCREINELSFDFRGDSL